MKPRIKALEARRKKLEAGHLPVPSYVVALTHEEFQLSEPEQRALIAERSGGRTVAVMPTKSADVQEWVRRYAPTH